MILKSASYSLILLTNEEKQAYFYSNLLDLEEAKNSRFYSIGTLCATKMQIDSVGIQEPPPTDSDGIQDPISFWWNNQLTTRFEIVDSVDFLGKKYASTRVGN